TGDAWAQTSFPPGYDDRADSVTAPASHGVAGQPCASLCEPFVHGWDEVQKYLDNRGIRLGIRYDGDVFSDLSGGRRRGATYLDNVNLQLTLDVQRLMGWSGATVFVYGLGIHGGRPSTYVGDAQGVSNNEAPAKWKLEEAWVQQNLFANRFSVLIGRYD